MYSLPFNTPLYGKLFSRRSQSKFYTFFLFSLITQTLTRVYCMETYLHPLSRHRLSAVVDLHVCIRVSKTVKEKQVPNITTTCTITTKEKKSKRKRIWGCKGKRTDRCGIKFPTNYNFASSVANRTLRYHWPCRSPLVNNY